MNTIDADIAARFKEDGGAFFPIGEVHTAALCHRAYNRDDDGGIREWAVSRYNTYLYCLNDSAMVDAAEELEDAALVLDDIAYENGLSLPTAKAVSLRTLAWDLRVSAREWAEEVTA